MNLLYSHRKIDEQFHVVDLDPYGTPAQFLGKVHFRSRNFVHPCIQMEQYNVLKRMVFSVLLVRELLFAIDSLIVFGFSSSN